MAFNLHSMKTLLAKRILNHLLSENNNELNIIDSDSDLSMPYVWDKTNLKAYLPFLDTEELNMLLLHKFQKKMIKENNNCSFILAISDTTGTILFYELTPGFVDKSVTQ